MQRHFPLVSIFGFIQLPYHFGFLKFIFGTIVFGGVALDTKGCRITVVIIKFVSVDMMCMCVCVCV